MGCGIGYGNSYCYCFLEIVFLDFVCIFSLFIRVQILFMELDGDGYYVVYFIFIFGWWLYKFIR